ncbi:hypothetical protein Sgou_48830 [Streptomyces gougerotii]|uniref:Uncharacterized protein n=1 Tax=Streptomyces gougerotii TaxID=53448 RepID=A0A8H9HPE0_9ACTN|nr:hypothetical protein Srut_22400 [Streptomyces rutgersensis]GFH80213.1 hypothetical protein Sgou_48830 [Streptomyces gougerotii]GGU77654.1 hypothetical protein GCM10010227_34800 [Streptomyces gougerotii]
MLQGAGEPQQRRLVGAGGGKDLGQLHAAGGEGAASSAETVNRCRRAPVSASPDAPEAPGPSSGDFGTGPGSGGRISSAV